MSKFKIKFYILKNDLEEMRTMNLQELESEYGNIYGQFTFEIDDYEYIFFTEEDTMPADIMPTECIDLHFYNLIKVIRKLSYENIAYMNYIENDWTWIRFELVNDKVVVCELYRKHNSIENFSFSKLDQVNEEYFKDAKVVSKMYEIDYSQFVSEVNYNLKKFVAILKETNELQSYNKHLVRLMN
jgi:hypothetical protein